MNYSIASAIFDSSVKETSMELICNTKLSASCTRYNVLRFNVPLTYRQHIFHCSAICVFVLNVMTVFNTSSAISRRVIVSIPLKLF